MQIIIPEGSGFCPGVIAAEKKLLKIRKENKGPIYISGMFIHNKEYEKYLNGFNIKKTENPFDLPEDSIFVIATHGIDRNIEANLEKRLKVFDLTCPKVKQIQKLIAQNSDKTCIIIGKEGHPETTGLKSYASSYILISSQENLYEPTILEKIKENRKIALFSQTTSSLALFNDSKIFFLKLKKDGKIEEVKIFNTICTSVQYREQKAIEVSRNCDVSIVLGDYLSSNSKRLYDNLKQKNDEVYFIEKPDDLSKIINNIKDKNKVMLVSSASTPSFIEDSVKNMLIKLGSSG